MRGAKARRLPAEPGWWTFIAGDLIMFGILFGTFVYYRAVSPAAYLNAHKLLSTPVGLLNTVVLLTGSLLVARAVEAYRERRAVRAQWLFLAGAGSGLVFAAVKAGEWGEKFAAGKTPLTSEFYMFYFTLTGIHLLHVMVGVMLLLFARAKAGSHRDDPANLIVVEIAGTFWHLVDLIWIVLFPLLYLTS